MIKQIIELIFAIIAVTLIAVIFLNPPTDYDGGQIFAYNLLFSLPLILLAGILSLISIIIVIIKFIHKKQEKKLIKIISLLLSIPVFIYFLLIVISFMTPVNYDYLDESIIPVPTYNSSDSIKVTENKTIYLVGYNWGGKNKKRRLYVSLKPYKNDEFNITETYCHEGDSSMAIYYQAKSDSIFVYLSTNYSVYTFVNTEDLNKIAAELDKIPLQTIQLSKERLDSLIVSDYDKKIKKFKWK